MRRIVGLVLLAVAYAQTAVTHIQADDASKHLIKAPKPDYPRQAEAARIQGNVILEIRIDEAGTASVQRVAIGHPLLVPAAIAAVSQWKYQPFEVDGKPTSVNTMVLVAFGDVAYYAADGRAEMAFQDGFWTAEESAEASLARGDLARADEQINKAGDLVSSDKDPRRKPERWQWMTTVGRLRRAQKKYPEAEESYRRALSLCEQTSENKDSPDLAASLSNLAVLFAEEKRFDLAHDHAVRALAIDQTNFKKAQRNNAKARQFFGRATAQELWLLVRVARERNDAVDATTQCNILRDFLEFLSAPERDSISAVCQPAIATKSTPQ